ncbi:hypothetical protein LuPra_00759 [Luteitalea pratensis]|uniref:Uncharacterized protein n=1 Tax=Luteitalea pratensis TaxID=1855912 RepID=A0A143PGN9_LUTPR|nr:hypothetical protein LuPra_00759 [Luteitalea pratensis]
MDTMARVVLGRCVHDPTAVRVYDIMRGGFLWSDEMPPCFPLDPFELMGVLAPVIAYRASLTSGAPDSRHEVDWNALRVAVPSWPGFRQERIRGSIEGDLRAWKLWEDRSFFELEDEPGPDGI